MSSTNKTSLGLNMWEASDKPVRQDFVNDNVILDDKISKLKQDFVDDNVILDEKISMLNSDLALKADKSSLGTKIVLSDTGVFHITRQVVIEYQNYYAVAVTITPTATPTSETPMLTFPKQLATCTLAITTGYASGIMYASNNNQMFYRLLTGAVDNTTEIIVNGIIPRA
jgi:hypothetical protein